MKILIPIILILVFSCEDDGIAPNYGCTNQDASNYDSSANVEDGSCIIIQPTYTYSTHIKPIIDNNCIRCHTEGGEEDAPTPYFYTYNLLKDCDCLTSYDLESSLYTTLLDDYMPYNSPPLSQEDKDKIRTWILEGLHE